MSTATLELGPDGMRQHLPEAERPPDFECFVPGIPRPQGSKTPNRNGRGMRESSKYVKGWRAEIAEVAARAWRKEIQLKGEGTGVYAKREPLDEPLMLGVVFLFPRPERHWRRCRVRYHSRVPRDSPCPRCGGEIIFLGADAPVYMTAKPDKDKLVRAVGDALVMAGVVRDDSLFVRDHESGCKRYANPGEQPGAWIRIWRLA
jgi:Holliday junction resolvase RusA-like endonuclease